MSKEWSAYFSEEELEAGRVLFEKNAVKGYISTRDSCIARVLAERVYNVSVRGMAEGRLTMGCNCDKALGGENCQHMAAVLFFWQSDSGERFTLRDNSVSRDDDLEERGEDQPFFQIRKMAAHLHISPKTKQEANEILEEGRMKVESFQLEHGTRGLPGDEHGVFRTLFYPQLEPQLQGGDTEGKQGKSKAKRVAFEFFRNRITQITCDQCQKRYYHGYSEELCAHMMAGFYQFCDYVKQYNPGDITDPVGEHFLSAYSQKNRMQRGESSAPAARVHLQPRLVQDGNHFQLTFRIGVNKLYVVRNLSDLISTVEAGLSLRLGQKDALHFHEETFTEKSAPVYAFIRSLVKGSREYIEQIAEKHQIKKEALSIKQMIRLEGNAADFLYDYIQEGGMVEFQEKNQGTRQRSLVATKHFPRIRLQLDPILDMESLDQAQVEKLFHSVLNQSEGYHPLYLYEISERKKMIDHLQIYYPIKLLTDLARTLFDLTGKNYNGVVLTGQVPQLIEGSKARYAIYDGKMLRFDEEDELSLGILLEAAGKEGLNLFFGKKHLAEFYYRVLPQLEENPRIQVQESIDFVESGLLPQEAKFEFRLDIEGGKLLAEGNVSYGEESFPILPMEYSNLAYDQRRDRQQEQRALALLQDSFPEFDIDDENFQAKATDDAIYQLLDRGIASLERLGEVKGSDDFMRLSIHSLPKLRIGVSVEANLMHLTLGAEQLNQEELSELLASYRRKKAYHKLNSGKFVKLEGDDSLAMLSQMMDDMGLTPAQMVEGKTHLPLYRALYMNRMLEEHSAVASDRDRLFRNLVKSFKTVEESDFELPEQLRDVLRPYQVYGYKWIRTLASYGLGGILADDMGLGKTLQMIAVLTAEKLEQKEQGEHATSLIVCPASLVYNWQEEFERFSSGIKTMTVTGSVPERKEILDRWQEADVLITSYDLLKRDIALYEPLEFDFQVLDEAQYIKNPQAAVSKAVKIVHSKHRFALTGTPIENRLSELWSIFDYLMPGFLYSYEIFRMDYETPIVKEEDADVIARLRRMTGPFVLRRLKKDVLKDLPAKIEEVRYARLSQEQSKLYQAQVGKMRAMISALGDGYRQNRIQVLAELTKIRQICCDPSILMENYKGTSAKREVCLELIHSAIDGGHKMLVFSQFTSMLSLLEEDLIKEKIPFYKITGATKKEERLRLVHAFNEDETPVFLISLKAGGTGLNLTGADLVIHYDPWWNLAAQNQATDRAHRIGQTKDVSVFRLIAKDTIEERILQMQEMKKDLADAILSGQSESLGQLSQEELLDLLS